MVIGLHLQNNEGAMINLSPGRKEVQHTETNRLQRDVTELCWACDSSQSRFKASGSKVSDTLFDAHPFIRSF
jgi:hypothetical protein